MQQRCLRFAPLRFGRRKASLGARNQGRQRRLNTLGPARLWASLHAWPCTPGEDSLHHPKTSVRRKHCASELARHIRSTGREGCCHSLDVTARKGGTMSHSKHWKGRMWIVFVTSCGFATCERDESLLHEVAHRIHVQDRAKFFGSLAKVDRQVVNQLDSSGKTNDGQSPVQLLADRYKQKILRKDVDPPGPLGHICMSLFCAAPLSTIAHCYLGHEHGTILIDRTAITAAEPISCTTCDFYPTRPAAV